MHVELHTFCEMMQNGNKLALGDAGVNQKHALRMNK